MPHPSIAMSGASPDGLVGSDGLVEFKCPNTATHINTLLGGTVPQKYVLQMLWQMECTGRQWCDFCPMTRVCRLRCRSSSRASIVTMSFWRRCATR